MPMYRQALNDNTGRARMLAYLRAHVTLRLLEELPRADVRSVAPRRTTIQLRTPGGPACHITVADGLVTFSNSPRLLPTVTLLFPRPQHLVATLTGGKAPVVPLPGSPRFLRAIAAFKALTARLQDAFTDPDARPRLLLLATLYGVQEVANRDPYVAARIARIPQGLIAVRVADDDTVAAWVRRTPDGIAAGPAREGASGLDRPNAVLEFADRKAVVDLLTGAVPAMLALAERRVRLYGRVPMIQNLFPVLDRVSDYLGG